MHKYSSMILCVCFLLCFVFQWSCGSLQSEQSNLELHDSAPHSWSWLSLHRSWHTGGHYARKTFPMGQSEKEARVDVLGQKDTEAREASQGGPAWRHCRCPTWVPVRRALILVHLHTSLTVQMRPWSQAENYPKDQPSLWLLLGISLARWSAHACLDIPNPSQFFQERSRIQFISLAVVRAKDACLGFSLAWPALDPQCVVSDQALSEFSRQDDNADRLPLSI